MDEMEDNEKMESLDAPNLTVLGLSVGASLSSVGCTLVRYRQDKSKNPIHATILLYDEIAVPRQIQSSIFALLRENRTNLHTMLQVHESLGQMLASAVRCLCKNHNISTKSIDLISAQADSYSDLVLHLSWPTSINLRSSSWIVALGREIEIPTVTNITGTQRPSGQSNSAAYVSISRLLLQHPAKFRVCLTINDLVNITLIPPLNISTPSTIPKLVSQYCGPGTLFTDYAMRYVSHNEIQTDHDGNYGACGTVNYSAVNHFLSNHHDSVRMPSMKIAFEMFGQHAAQSLIDDCVFLDMSARDTVATITYITAQNIVINYHRLLDTFFPNQKVDELFVCGLGANNMNVMDHLKTALPDTIIKSLEDIGIPGNANYSLGCAQLGFETLLGHTIDDVPVQMKEQEQQVLSGFMSKGNRWEETEKKLLKFREGNKTLSVQDVVAKHA
ncbi:hypothetical protein DM02DRAFT_613556 [Periconia macrospinosa]|uniref:Uncharacterized protein n=1 Tax=Periconia macrospinosa TaxID=97972 RepID=A0A2V1DTK1_9PLEO|nr:hypothetical protein DM02DRAFT_613556 [Periconia macrospinosa]